MAGGASQAGEGSGGGDEGVVLSGPNRSPVRAWRRWCRVTLWVILLVFVVPPLVALGVRAYGEQPHWRDADHASAGLAPLPEEHPGAVAQVYAARTWGTRGGVAVHTWIAVKRAGAGRYTRHEVIGWRLARTGTAVVSDGGRPADGAWFSNPPTRLADLRGAAADAAIDKIEAAVAAYPHRREYRTWPGPNSNTFTAFVGRRVPELRLDLPPTAIGKDYLAGGAVFARAPSGTGWQTSIFGAAGVLVALREGIEINLLGMAAGVRPWPLAIKLPGLGTWPSRHVAAGRSR